MNIPQLVKEKILEIDKNAEVILFGSRARGDFHEESDWDFLVLLDEKGSLSRSKKSDLRNHLFDLQLDTLQCISLIVKNKEEWENYINTSLYRNIKKEGFMVHTKKDIVKTRIAKAKTTFDDAVFLKKNDSYNAIANRLYYACFYAVSAYLACKEIDAHTHSGVKTILHRDLVKEGLISKDYGKHYETLFDLRLDADYEDFVYIEETDVNPLFEITKSFITEIEKIIASNSDCLDD